MEIYLRRAIYEDASKIHHTFFANEPWYDFHSRFFHWISGQVENRLIYLLAEQDEVLVGQGQLHFFRRDRAEIANVCVAAAFQRQGVGTAIISQLLQEAQARPCLKIELCVAENNQAAQSLYRQLGFEVVSSIVTLQDGLAFVMAKELAY